MHHNTYEKYKHLIGSKINKWTILDIVAHIDKQHTYALAKCDCGTIKEVRLTYITNNKTKDCGCGHRQRLQGAIKKKYEHLIGTQINGWTILDIIPPDSNDTKTLAHCKCKCGAIKNVQLSYIINERSKDCGCGRKNTLRETRTKNIVGQRFGKLVVVELLEKSNRFNRRLYRCKCDCGNEIIVPSSSLITDHTHSCGCLLSYYNMYIKQFLDTNNIENQSEYTVFIGNKYYRFDFYLPQYNLFIEYDGKQHYEPVQYYGNNIEDAKNALRKTQEHDKIKDKYCKDNNINLLRIPYWENNNIETIISNHLQRLNEKGFAKVS